MATMKKPSGIGRVTKMEKLPRDIIKDCRTTSFGQHTQLFC
jgi:hypothetical protein